MIKPVNTYSKIANFFANKNVQKIFKYAEKNPALFQSGTVFMSASILRPMTLLSSPAKTEERRKDNLYSSSRSIASGVTDLGFSSMLFLPTNKAINKIGDKCFNNKKSLLYNDLKACKMYKNILNRGLKIAVIPIIAYLNFKYLTNIANGINSIIGVKKGKNENK